MRNSLIVMSRLQAYLIVCFASVGISTRAILF
jgi:hypothetical protein